jgi:hypothetical protein
LSKCIDEVNLLTNRIKLQKKQLEEIQAKMLLQEQLGFEAKVKEREEIQMYEE